MKIDYNIVNIEISNYNGGFYISAQGYRKTIADFTNDSKEVCNLVKSIFDEFPRKDFQISRREVAKIKGLDKCIGNVILTLVEKHNQN